MAGRKDASAREIDPIAVDQAVASVLDYWRPRGVAPYDPATPPAEPLEDLPEEPPGWDHNTLESLRASIAAGAHRRKLPP